mmetsp:Transcript_4112/g.8435  ORF Transcript_4112/g.8435 Transcript_4112/m.8435 type:complete len:342 (-) Transcript_4112:248-1273(-)
MNGALPCVTQRCIEASAKLRSLLQEITGHLPSLERCCVTILRLHEGVVENLQHFGIQQQLFSAGASPGLLLGKVDLLTPLRNVGVIIERSPLQGLSMLEAPLSQFDLLMLARLPPSSSIGNKQLLSLGDVARRIIALAIRLSGIAPHGLRVAIPEVRSVVVVENASEAQGHLGCAMWRRNLCGWKAMVDEAPTDLPSLNEKHWRNLHHVSLLERRLGINAIAMQRRTSHLNAIEAGGREDSLPDVAGTTLTAPVVVTCKYGDLRRSLERLDCCAQHIPEATSAAAKVTGHTEFLTQSHISSCPNIDVVPLLATIINTHLVLPRHVGRPSPSRSLIVKTSPT